MHSGGGATTPPGPATQPSHSALPEACHVYQWHQLSWCVYICRECGGWGRLFTELLAWSGECGICSGIYSALDPAFVMRAFVICENLSPIWPDLGKGEQFEFLPLWLHPGLGGSEKVFC